MVARDAGADAEYCGRVCPSRGAAAEMQLSGTDVISRVYPGDHIEAAAASLPDVHALSGSGTRPRLSRDLSATSCYTAAGAGLAEPCCRW